jgi:hypothetical protein
MAWAEQRYIYLSLWWAGRMAPSVVWWVSEECGRRSTRLPRAGLTGPLIYMHEKVKGERVFRRTRLLRGCLVQLLENATPE